MFSNPHGLCDKGNKSCASDLGKLSYYFMQQEFLKKVVNTKSITVKIQNKNNNTRNFT